MSKKNTLVWGTANPEGMNDSYKGIYLNNQDITSMIDQVNSANVRQQPIPVKIEHAGVPLGHVVSAWENKGSLECVIQINEDVFEGSIGAEFVRSGICKDLSLGYTVDMEQSKKGIHSKKKTLNEISFVKKGGRKNCHIHGISKKDK